MTHYLFDADDTLLETNEARETALRTTLGLYDIPLTFAALHAFVGLCQEDSEEVLAGRVRLESAPRRVFQNFLQTVGSSRFDAAEVASLYAGELAKAHFLRPGALECCRELSKKSALYVVTNGAEAVQKPRLLGSPLASCLTGIFCADKIGFAKPNKYFFQNVLSSIGDPSDVWVVGAEPAFDMAGGAAAGLKTCWLNPGGADYPAGLPQPMRTIGTLKQLLTDF